MAAEWGQWPPSEDGAHRWSALEAGCVHLWFKAQERVILSFFFSGMNQGSENTKDTMLIYCCPAGDTGEWRREGGGRKRIVFSSIRREQPDELVARKSFPR